MTSTCPGPRSGATTSWWRPRGSVAARRCWGVAPTLRGELELEVDAVDASASVDAIERHVAVMASAVNGRAKDVSIRAALCFHAEYWGEAAPKPFWIDGVLVTHPA